jgi:hypothetical protein
MFFPTTITTIQNKVTGTTVIWNIYVVKTRYNSMCRRYSGDSDVIWFCQDVCCWLLWSPNIHYRVHKSPVIVPLPGEINPVHTLTSYFSVVSRKLREAPYYLHYVHPSVRPHVWARPLLSHTILETFIKMCREGPSWVKNRTKISSSLHKDLRRFHIADSDSGSWQFWRRVIMQRTHCCVTWQRIYYLYCCQ